MCSLQSYSDATSALGTNGLRLCSLYDDCNIQCVFGKNDGPCRAELPNSGAGILAAVIGGARYAQDAKHNPKA